jgi:uncharacterized SAM-binding protein YcdF (DUF218 family)
MPRSPAPPAHSAAILQRALLAALAWIAAAMLGFPAVLGVPFPALLPVALVAGAALGLTRFGRLVDWSAVFLVVLTLVVAFTPVLTSPVRVLIEEDPIPATGIDAIVVLSAAVSPDSLLSPEGAARLLHGVELLRAGVATTLITSRVRHRQGSRTVTSDADQGRLIRLAPDSVRWMVVDSVATTREEAVRVAALAAREGLRHVIVVTSALHTRRACAAFRRVGLTVTCAAAPSRPVAVRSMATASDRIGAFGPWLYETLGWWWYGVKGWR